MQFICDFHVHSKYSRATSKEMDLENLEKWAAIKGISVIGTGDFTHPAWFKELSAKLEPAESGLYKLKNAGGKSAVRFILTAEISSIYSKGGKTRRVHNLIFSPSLEIAGKINERLGAIGNLKSDGRPILGLGAKELAEIVFGVSGDCLVVPAHVWTPWFSVFGSMSGFDSLEECFEELAPKIHAIETGLSSDPAMNWRVSGLDRLTLISNSDSHSPAKIGREANIFELESLSYPNIAAALKKSSTKNKLVKTIEFFPEEGKYHHDGHAACGVNFSPAETKKHKGICPKCGKSLVIGVLNRVGVLANRPAYAKASAGKEIGKKPAGATDFVRLIPLEEIIAGALDFGVSSKAVQKQYFNLIEKLGNEFEILLDAPIGKIAEASLPLIAEGVKRVREGKIKITPGFDGVYGKINIFSKRW